MSCARDETEEKGPRSGKRSRLQGGERKHRGSGNIASQVGKSLDNFGVRRHLWAEICGARTAEFASVNWSTAVAMARIEMDRDFGFALRQLRTNLRFSVIVVLTLALGIGATTAIFSVVSGVLLRALPFPEAERIVSLQTIEYPRSDADSKDSGSIDAGST